MLTSALSDDDNTKNSRPFINLKSFRVILRKAHPIKGRSTRWARAAYYLDVQRWWHLTGLLIHIHLSDLVSLLHQRR